MFGILTSIAASVLPSIVGGLFNHEQQPQPQAQPHHHCHGHHGHHHHGHHYGLAAEDFRMAREDFRKAQRDLAQPEYISLGSFFNSPIRIPNPDYNRGLQELSDARQHLADGYSHLREYI